MSIATLNSIAWVSAVVAVVSAAISVLITGRVAWIAWWSKPEGTISTVDCQMCDDVTARATSRVSAPSDDHVTEDEQIVCCDACVRDAVRAVESGEHATGPAYVDPL